MLIVRSNDDEHRLCAPLSLSAMASDGTIPVASRCILRTRRYIMRGYAVLWGVVRWHSPTYGMGRRYWGHASRHGADRRYAHVARCYI